MPETYRPPTTKPAHMQVSGADLGKLRVSFGPGAGRTRVRTMFRLTSRRLPLAVAALTVLGVFGTVPTLAPAASAATTLCNSQTASVGGGTYIVQNNEWNSSAVECVSTDSGADFNVHNSSINNGNGGAPGGYPSIYQGCHWGLCSSGGLTTTPVQAS